MEAWLAELESFLDDNTFQQQYQETETLEAAFDEQLATALGEDISYPLAVENDDTASHQWDFDSISEYFTSSPHISNNNNNNTISRIDHYNINVDSNNNNQNILSSDTVEGSQQFNNNKEDEGNQKFKNKEDDGNKANKQAVSRGRKRKRQPSQVQDHIIAERKRREVLGQMFISLSAIVPGLKKTDKMSVLGEAIKHMKKLQEKVKVLQEEVAKRTVESIVVVKKSKLIIDNDDGVDNDTSSTIDNNFLSGSSDGNPDGGSGGGGNRAYNFNKTLPDIEVQIAGKTLLLKICCEVQKGIFAKLFMELEKQDMSVTNCSIIPLNSLALDITIVAQMESGITNVEDFAKSVRAALRLTTHQCHASNYADEPNS